MYRQHNEILITSPELMGVHQTGENGCNDLRIKFRRWPGQGFLIETTLKQRLLAQLREYVPDYADWMITVTYRAVSERIRGTSS